MTDDEAGHPEKVASVTGGAGYQAGRDRRLREARGMALRELRTDKRRRPLKRYFFLSLLVILALTWITWPSIGQINTKDCTPNGIAANLSAMIHGDKFWSVQLAAIHNSLLDAENWDRKQAEIKSEVERMSDEAARRAQAELDAMYEQHPSLAPAPTEAQQLRERAQELIDRADEIEMNEARKLISDQMRKQVPILRQCEDTIVARLHKP
jgi:hypothetical protein